MAVATMRRRVVSGPVVVARWRARPGWAGLAGVVWAIGHLLVAIVVSNGLALLIGRPRGWPATIAWFAGMCVVSGTTMAATQRMARRLLPLRALLKLDLAFPAAAPSRFRIALRSGNPQRLTRQVDDVRGAGLGTGPAEAAETLLALVAALAHHDRATRGHSERVRAYAELIAEELRLDRPSRDGLRWAGLIHDIGKLFVPAEVLNKTSPLTSDDWALIRRHPEDGAALAAPLEPWLGPWTTGVLDHHERWDGAGYPRQLAGTDISLAGRVVAVADAYDVMTSARTYKRPAPADEARSELVACSGTQFDAEVVRAFLGISIRKVRAVMGPLSVLPRWAQVRWRLRPITSRIAAPLAIGAIAGSTWLVAPTRPARHGAPRSESASAPADAATAADTSTPPVAPPPPATGSVRADAPAGRPSPLDVLAAAAATPPSVPARPPTIPAMPTTDRPASAPAARHPAIVVDPSEGSVSIQDLGPATAPDVTLVDVAAVGVVACGEAQVCDPVTVPLPPLA